MTTPAGPSGAAIARGLLFAALATLATACSHVPHLPWSASAPPPAATDAEPPDEAATRTLVVTATAYNSVPSQTGRVPDVGAWGDRLKPGMRAIAVTPDLLHLGLKRGQKVRIAGLPGEWTVLDKVPPRWSRRIDLFMGKDVRAARQWGKRKVEISW
jgi:3D (Asp-Asp-Asp) domain-containing protein